MAALIKRLQGRYLGKLSSQIDGIEDEVIEAWSRRLAGFTPEEIKRGLDQWDSDWPPSADEFAKACKGGNWQQRGPAYRILDRTRLLSSTARDAARETAREHLRAMRASVGLPEATADHDDE